MVTAEATGRAPTGEAGFRLLTEQLPDIAILAFDQELEIWAATGGGTVVEARLPLTDPSEGLRL